MSSTFCCGGVPRPAARARHRYYGSPQVVRGTGSLRRDRVGSASLNSLGAVAKWIPALVDGPPEVLDEHVVPPGPVPSMLMAISRLWSVKATDVNDRPDLNVRERHVLAFRVGLLLAFWCWLFRQGQHHGQQICWLQAHGNGREGTCLDT